MGLLGLEEISFDPVRDHFMRAECSMVIVFKASKTLIHDLGVPPYGTTGPRHLAFAATHEGDRNVEVQVERGEVSHRDGILGWLVDADGAVVTRYPVCFSEQASLRA